MKPLPANPRQILVTCPQRLGDVLLTTALIRSLKQAWPAAAIDVLVLRGTESVLAGNPDIRQVLVQVQRASLWAKLREALALWRRYDITVAAIPTDRSRLSAWIGGRFRIGFLTPQQGEQRKAFLLDRHVSFDDLDTHTVSMQAQLLTLLKIPARMKVVLPHLDQVAQAAFTASLSDTPYVVLHPCPKFRYKMWRQHAWVELAEWLHSCGLNVIFSGGGDADELAYVAAIQSQLSFESRNFAGQLSLAHTSALLDHATLYVGPDTVVTHMAAASGTPTLALFGPSNPVKWGPWPANRTEPTSPWSRVGSGRQGNVFLLQGQGSCVPCLLEGCERNVNSVSDCLEHLEVQRVKDAVQNLLDASGKSAVLLER